MHTLHHLMKAASNTRMACGMVTIFASMMVVFGITTHAIAQGAGTTSGDRLISGVIAATSAVVEISYVQPDGDVVGRIAGVGDPVYLDDEITTGPGNRLQILLADQTVFSIGPNSALVIDSFVFDPTAGSSDLVASVKRGSFKFISGKIAKQGPDKMKLRLPNSTASIRGTSVAGTVGNDGGSSVVLLSGAISVTSLASNAIADLVQPGWGVAVDAQGSVGAPEQYSAEAIETLLNVVEFAPAEEDDTETGGDAAEDAGSEEDGAAEETTETAEAEAENSDGTQSNTAGQNDAESGDTDGRETDAAEGEFAAEPLLADATEVKEILAENGIELDEAEVAALIDGEALIGDSEFEELFSEGELSPEDLEKELTLRLEARLGGGEGSDEKASSLASLFVQGFGDDGDSGPLPDDIFAGDSVALGFGDQDLDAPRISFESLFAGPSNAANAAAIEKVDIFSADSLGSVFGTQSLERSETSFDRGFTATPDIPDVKLTVARYAITFDDLKFEDVQFLAAIEEQPVFDTPLSIDRPDNQQSFELIKQYDLAEQANREALESNSRRELSSSEIGALMVKYLQDGGVPQWATVTNDGSYVIGNPEGAVVGTAYAGIVSEAYSGSATFSNSGIPLGRGSITLNTADGDQTWTSNRTGSGTAAYKVTLNYNSGSILGSFSYSNLVMDGTSFANTSGVVSSGGAVAVGQVDNIDLGQVQSQDATSTYTADAYLSASIGSATDGTNVIDGLIGKFDMNFFVEGNSQYVTNSDGDYLDSQGNVTPNQSSAASVPILSAIDYSTAD